MALDEDREETVALKVPRLPKPPFPYTAPTVPGGVEPREPTRTLGADYDSDWARRFPARFARTVLLEAVLRPADPGGIMRVLAGAGAQHCQDAKLGGCQADATAFIFKYGR